MKEIQYLLTPPQHPPPPQILPNGNYTGLPEAPLSVEEYYARQQQQQLHNNAHAYCSRLLRRTTYPHLYQTASLSPIITRILCKQEANSIKITQNLSSRFLSLNNRWPSQAQLLRFQW